MNRYLLLVGTFLAVVLAFAVPVRAADMLAQAAPAPSPSPTPTPKPLQLSGYVDAGYDNASASAPSGAISGRVFDNVNARPQLQTVNFTAAYTGTLGGKLELNAGQDANVIHSYPQSLYICTGGNVAPGCTPPYAVQVDVTQAYASFTTNKFTLIGGKFETLAGAEVIESPSDMNFSRSILFGYAVPFTHTGVRLTYAATSQLSIIVGANRGWDTTYPLSQSTLNKLAGTPPGTLSADSSSLTGELGVAFNPSSVFSLTAQGYSGKPENWQVQGCANSSCSRSLVDVVGTYHVTPSLAAVVNFDDGTQTNTTSPAFTSGVGTVTWKGVAGYLSETFNPSITGTLRYEQFVDAQGYRTGFGVGTRWNEGTATAAFTVSPNMTLRGELRADTASQPIFASTKGGGAQQMLTTYGMEAIYHVP